MDEELIFSTLALLMDEVQWGDPEVGFVTTSRRVKLWNDVPFELKPVCYQAEWGDSVGQISGMPYKTILEANWIIYQDSAQDPNTPGAILNNLIIEGVYEALAPKPADPGFHDERNTLGGLVYHCFIQGRLFKAPGDIDGQGMMVIPIKLLVP